MTVLEKCVTNIFVGNLSYQTTESELEAAFAAYGAVERASVVRDRDSGQPRGFAFVEMTNHEEAMKAIQSLNGQELNGRQINVKCRPGRRPSAAAADSAEIAVVAVAVADGAASPAGNHPLLEEKVKKAGPLLDRPFSFIPAARVFSVCPSRCRFLLILLLRYRFRPSIAIGSKFRNTRSSRGSID